MTNIYNLFKYIESIRPQYKPPISMVFRHDREKFDATIRELGGVLKGDLDISELGLTELPKLVKVKGNFLCNDNKLRSLKGAPKEIGGTFWCYRNDLTSLEGGPEKVGGVFNCSENDLTSLKGAPKEVGMDFWCYGNSVKFTEEQVRSVCNVKGKVYV